MVIEFAELGWTGVSEKEMLFGREIWSTIFVLLEEGEVGGVLRLVVDRVARTDFFADILLWVGWDERANDRVIRVR